MRIKVTAYIDPEELEENIPGSVDEEHEMGVSNEFYEAFTAGAGLTSHTGQRVFVEEVSFEAVDE